MLLSVVRRALIAVAFVWIYCIEATFQWPPPPIRNTEIQPGTLVFFLRNRVQNSRDLDRRAEKLDMQLARIMDPPFNGDQSRVNIEKVFDPSINVGVKPKYLTLAKSMFYDQSELAPSPNQKLKLEIFKVPGSQPVDETIVKQIILANRLEHCDTAFFMYRARTGDMMHSVLQRTQKCASILSQDSQEIRGKNKHKSEYLMRFLDEITSPLHLDNNTLDDFRELVAHNVFSFFVEDQVEAFEEMVNVCTSSTHERNPKEPKAFKILRVFYRNLQRDQPTVCPKLEVMRDDFVDFKMVQDLLFFIWQRCVHVDTVSTIRYLPTLHKLMGSDAATTKAMWDWGARDADCQIVGLLSIADFICRKVGLRTGYEDSFTNDQVYQAVREIRNALDRGWHIFMRTHVFGAYWEQLYKLKLSGFSGRIAIVNRDYILEESWIQSLLGIFGRDNTEIERVAEL